MMLKQQIEKLIIFVCLQVAFQKFLIQKILFLFNIKLLNYQLTNFQGFLRVKQKIKMKNQQMRPQLILKMKNTIERFNISTETYYHAILLFNVIQLKKKQHRQPEYYTIPIKKKSFQWSQDSDDDNQNYQFKEPETQYIQVHYSQMPQKQKLQLTVCLFLVHKLYEPYPVCLTYMMRYLEIDQRYEDYLLSLEKQFLIKLTYKIENMLPSNQALFACSLWDQFVENISQGCIDIRFEINSLLSSSKKQIKTAHEIQTVERQPEFKNIKNIKSFDKLCYNIQILVHNKSLYELYLKNSCNQNHDDLPSMKKIGIAIVYITILQSTQMIFGKKYTNPFRITDSKKQNTNYIDFAFNDFLETHYGLHLDSLNEQIELLTKILSTKRQVNEQIVEKNKYHNKKIQSTKKIKQQHGSGNLSKFLLRQKRINQQYQMSFHHQYHQKHLFKNRNQSISSTKTDQQKLLELNAFKGSNKNKCRSILVDKQSIKNYDKILQSTIHQSNISEIGQSVDNCIAKYEIQGFQYDDKNMNQQKTIKSIKKQNKFAAVNINKVQKKYSKKSEKGFENLSIGKSSKSSYLKSNHNKHARSLVSSNSNSHKYKHSLDHGYKVSHFVTIDD